MKEERRRRTEEGEEDCQIVGESRGGAFISITSSREDEEEESEKGVVGQENRNFFTAAFDKERNRERGGEQEKEERTDKRKQKKRGRDLSSTSSSTSSHAAKKKKTKEKREDTVPVKCKIEPCKVARKDRGAQSRSSVQNSSCSTSSSSPSSLSHSSSSSQSSSLSSPSSSSSSSPSSSSSSSSSSSALSPKGYLPTALGYASRLSRHPNKGPVGNPELEESDPSVLHEKLNQVVSLFQNECRSIISTWKSRHLVKKRKEGKSRLTSPQHHDVPSSSPSYDRSLQGGCTYTREPTKEEGDDNEVSVLYAVEPEKRREEEEEEENNEDEREEENTFFSPGGVCVHTGAGVSTSAGILDFRGPSGVWTLEAQGKELHDAEKNTVEVSFGRHRRPVKAFHLALPTPTHLLLKTLSTVPAPVWLSSQRTDACSHLHHPPHHPASPTGRRILSSSPNPSPPPPPSSSSSSPSPPCSHCSLPLSSSSPPPPLVRHIITQNVDGLHMRCGTSFSRLSEVHGRICSFPPSGVCTDVLLDWRDRYERDLEHFALRHSRAASLHLCLGTSLQIQPACHFPGKERSTKSFLIIVNLQATPLDSSSDICLRYTTDGVSTFLARELGKGLLSRDRGGEEEEEKENADEQGERGYTDEEGERDKGDGDVALVKGERIERRREEDLNDGEDQDDVVMNYKEGECPQNVGRRPREEDKERKKKKENERNCENMNDREKERRSLKNEENRTQMKKEEKANVNDGAFKEEEDRGKRRRGREGTSQVLGWIWSKREGGRWGDVGTVTLKNRETPLDKVRQRHAKDSDSHALLDIMRERKMVGKETEEKTEEKDDRNERDARANGDLGMASARERDGEEEKKEKEEKETEGYEEETRRVVMSSEDEKKDKEEEKRKKATARELNGNEIPLFQKTEEEYYRQGDQERKEEKERRGEEETFWRGKEEKEQDNKRGREKRDGIEGRKVEHFPFIRTSLLFILRVPLHSVPALALPILPPSSSPPPSSSSSHNGRSSSSFACGARKVHTPAAASTSAASLHPEIPSHPPEGGEQGEGGEQQQEERRQEGEEEKKKTVMEKKKIEGEEDTARPQDFQTDCEILLEEEKEKKDGKEKGLEKETSASTLVDGHLRSPGEISGDEKVRKRNTIHDSISSSSSFSSPGVSNYRKVIPSGEDSKEDQGSVPVSSSSSLSSSSSSFDLRKSSSFSRFRREQRFLLRISCGIRIIEEISPCSSSSLLGNLAEEEVKEDGDRGSYDSPPHRHLERRKEGCSREVGDSSDTRAKISHVDTLRGVWTVDISQDTHLQVLLWYNTTLRITLFYQPYQRG
ncbi:histone deacetylase sir2-like, partial [Cystoisospora suis]